MSSMGLHDVASKDRARIRLELRKRLTEAKYEVVWVEGEVSPWMRSALARSYVVGQRYDGDDRYRPMVGYMSEAGMVETYRAPQLWLVRAKPRPVPHGGVLIADFEDGSFRGFLRHGDGFGLRPIRSVSANHPAVGPMGGEFLLSSGASRLGVKATGVMETRAFFLPEAGGWLEMLAGYGGSSQGLRLEVVDAVHQETAPIKLLKTHWSLKTHRWTVPVAWAGKKVRVRLTDQSKRATILLDDLWMFAPSSP